MVIDMLVHPMLYGEICTPGDELMDSVFGHENLVWGIWAPWIGMSFKSRWTLRRAEERAHAARCNHGMRRTLWHQ